MFFSGVPQGIKKIHNIEESVVWRFIIGRFNCNSPENSGELLMSSDVHHVTHEGTGKDAGTQTNENS